MHDKLSLGLFKVRVHLPTFNFIIFKSFCNLFHFDFRRCENDYTFWNFLRKKATNNTQFLIFITYICCLNNLFLAWIQLISLHRIIQNRFRKLLDFGRHSRRKHNSLSLFRQILHNLHNIFIESHVSSMRSASSKMK